MNADLEEEEDGADLSEELRLNPHLVPAEHRRPHDEPTQDLSDQRGLANPLEQLVADLCGE